VDDELVSREEAREIAAAPASIDRGEGVTNENVLVEFGLICAFTISETSSASQLLNTAAKPTAEPGTAEHRTPRVFCREFLAALCANKDDVLATPAPFPLPFAAALLASIRVHRRFEISAWKDRELGSSRAYLIRRSQYFLHELAFASQDGQITDGSVQTPKEELLHFRVPTTVRLAQV
jgi:hypothetical protein